MLGLSAVKTCSFWRKRHVSHVTGCFARCLVMAQVSDLALLSSRSHIN
jgi:hypothetical protein